MATRDRPRAVTCGANCQVITISEHNSSKPPLFVRAALPGAMEVSFSVSLATIAA